MRGAVHLCGVLRVLVYLSLGMPSVALGLPAPAGMLIPQGKQWLIAHGLVSWIHLQMSERFSSVL